MTKLLEKAFEKASKLPEAEQNVIAKWLLEELESERNWEKSFSESEDVLDILVKETIDAYEKGKTDQLDVNKLWLQKLQRGFGRAMIYFQLK